MAEKATKKETKKSDTFVTVTNRFGRKVQVTKEHAAAMKAANELK